MPDVVLYIVAGQKILETLRKLENQTRAAGQVCSVGVGVELHADSNVAEPSPVGTQRSVAHDSRGTVAMQRRDRRLP